VARLEVVEPPEGIQQRVLDDIVCVEQPAGS